MKRHLTAITFPKPAFAPLPPLAQFVCTILTALGKGDKMCCDCPT